MKYRNNHNVRSILTNFVLYSSLRLKKVPYTIINQVSGIYFSLYCSHCQSASSRRRIDDRGLTTADYPPFVGTLLYVLLIRDCYLHKD